jgi:predicted PurR-regulated permease PerM
MIDDSHKTVTPQNAVGTLGTGLVEETPEAISQRRLNATFVEVALHLGLVGILLYWTFILIKPFIPIGVWSVVLTVALYPVFDWLRTRLGGRSSLAAAAITILGLLIVLGPATWLGIGLIEGSRTIIQRIEHGELTVPPPSPAVKDWPVIGPSLHDFWTLASTNLQSALEPVLPQLKPAGEVLLEAASSAGAGTLKFILSVVVMGFLFSLGPRIVAAVKTLAQRIDPSRGEQFVELSGATIRAVSRGVIGVSLLQAVLAGVSMALAGVPFASVLTLAILVLGIVQIGPLIVAVPLAVWGWMTLPVLSAAAFTVSMAAVYAVEAVLKPFALAHGLTTPALVIFVGVIGGIIAHGFAGLFAGPIVLAVAWEMANAWIYGRSTSQDRAVTEHR